ncbi:MAG: UbiA-like polyprenyltransferase [Actinomycetota bacterium]|nr:UbiA-like polyprenyltransferase [Actinomycetota bacterium]MDI6821651.1 UbiA-like polyprenyltransferase [Actinomycetota bacterium]
MRSGTSMGLNKISLFFQTIKFEHTVFALPFAYMSAFLAVEGIPAFRDFFWITMAMVGARTLAMSLNRLIDKEIDARNPRTSQRALPRGLLSTREMVLFSLISFFVFMMAVYELAPLCRYLWPLVIIPFVVYPYTKRFTWTSHFLLGLCLGLAPLGAWVAIRNGLSLVPILLGLAVCFWVAGFDIIYSCQDVRVDREQGLYSIPARFGIKKGLQVTALLHVLTVIFLIGVGLSMGAGIFYYLGVTVVAFLLAYENRLVSPDDLSRVNEAFFTTNGFISILMFVFTVLSLRF